MTVAAVLLAAGRSTRMGQPKAWLRLAGESLLGRTVRVCQEAGVHPVVIVAGSERPEPGLVSVAEARAGLRLSPAIRFAVGSPDATPIDSLRAGLAELPSGQPFLLWPVDHPFADAELVRRLCEAHAEAGDRIVLPVADGRRGHPVLFGARPATELLEPGADDGAHRVVRRLPGRVVEVASDDVRIAATLNTPGDARALGVDPRESV